ISWCLPPEAQTAQIKFSFTYPTTQMAKLEKKTNPNGIPTLAAIRQINITANHKAGLKTRAIKQHLAGLVDPVNKKEHRLGYSFQKEVTDQTALLSPDPYTAAGYLTPSAPPLVNLNKEQLLTGKIFHDGTPTWQDEN